MIEVHENSAVSKLALDAQHRQLNASMEERDGWLVPRSYNDIAVEYQAVRGEGAGLIDLSARGRVLVTGSEAVQFLNGLVTNDLKTLAENSWMPAAFPNAQGRLIAAVRIANLPLEGKPAFLIDTDPVAHAKVRQMLERFTFAGDFHLRDLTNETALLSLQGKTAEKILGSVIERNNVPAEAQALTQFRWKHSDVDSRMSVMHASHTGADGFDLFVENHAATKLWLAMVEAGAQPLGYETLETLRIEAGIPRYGVDMDETNIVTETNLDDAVSYTKGCYIGQEIIARIKYRGHVAKKLAGLVLDQKGTPIAGAIVKSTDDKDIGKITSTTRSPALDRTIALAYLKYDWLKPGTRVKVTGDQEFEGEVIELPFLR
ncbi:MAG TPA: aminomethyltransferase family protein [Pyrinomonadaceae bacterium]|nr:aminomethyltransferase family protein [Pyrinomonadaceae bacterium]